MQSSLIANKPDCVSLLAKQISLQSTSINDSLLLIQVKQICCCHVFIILKTCKNLIGLKPYLIFTTITKVCTVLRLLGGAHIVGWLNINWNQPLSVSPIKKLRLLLSTMGYHLARTKSNFVSHQIQTQISLLVMRNQDCCRSAGPYLIQIPTNKMKVEYFKEKSPTFPSGKLEFLYSRLDSKR